jgi:predicted dehydrogenase
MRHDDICEPGHHGCRADSWRHDFVGERIEQCRNQRIASRRVAQEQVLRHEIQKRTQSGLVEVDSAAGQYGWLAVSPSFELISALADAVPRRGSARWKAIDVPASYRTVPDDLPESAANVGGLYAQLALDLRAGTRLVPDFRDASRYHALLDAIERANLTGERQALASAR